MITKALLICSKGTWSKSTTWRGEPRSSRSTRQQQWRDQATAASVANSSGMLLGTRTRTARPGNSNRRWKRRSNWLAYSFFEHSSLVLWSLFTCSLITLHLFCDHSSLVLWSLFTCSLITLYLFFNHSSIILWIFFDHSSFAHCVFIECSLPTLQ